MMSPEEVRGYLQWVIHGEKRSNLFLPPSLSLTISGIIISAVWIGWHFYENYRQQQLVLKQAAELEDRHEIEAQRSRKKSQYILSKQEQKRT